MQPDRKVQPPQPINDHDRHRIDAAFIVLASLRIIDVARRALDAKAGKDSPTWLFKPDRPMTQAEQQGFIYRIDTVANYVLGTAIDDDGDSLPMLRDIEIMWESLDERTLKRAMAMGYRSLKQAETELREVTGAGLEVGIYGLAAGIAADAIQSQGRSRGGEPNYPVIALRFEPPSP